MKPVAIVVSRLVKHERTSWSFSKPAVRWRWVTHLAQRTVWGSREPTDE